MTRTPARPFRSREWFDAPGRSDMAALYLERYMNYGLTPDELRCGKPIIGISQSGSDLTPCNRIHIELVERVKAGIRDAGGIPMEFPMHPIFENCRRPTAALDRNLAYLGLVETLNGYPIDAVVLTTGCDKTNPASIMAASTVDIPAITLSGGPMLDGWHEGELVGSGLFENPYADAATAEAKTATSDAIALAREAAQKAVVLLKNDKGVLPLNPANIRRMAVVGTHARNTPIGGYSDEPRHVVSVLEGLQSAAQGRFEVDYAEGVRLTETRCWSCDEVKLVPAEVNRKLIADAVETARKSDVVVMVLGENEQLSREAWADAHLGDRASLDMVGQQEELARAIFALGKPTVVILLNGRPLSVNYLAANAPAMIEGWYLGQETGNAVTDVLFGTVNPGGKLPVSFARSAGQLPVYYNRKPTSRRGYLFDSTAPLYPFGFGLSYTTFDVSAPRFARSAVRVGDNVQVSVDVANTGRRSGDEVVQLYVRDDEASITRPLLELKRFQRVTLQPGERRTVTFELKPDDLSLWNMEMKRVLEPGTFTISAGPNSVDLKSAKLTVAAR